MRRKNRLKVLLVILVSIFIMFSAAALLLAGFQKSEREAQKKKWQRWKVCRQQHLRKFL